MAATRRRWAAAAGAVLALLAAAPASASSTARAHNPTAQVVSTARWSVVVVPGTSPATGAAPPAVFNATLLTPAHLTLTNTGSVVPGTMTLTGSTGLNLLGGVSICRVPWVGTTCSQPVTFLSPVFTAGQNPAPPAPGVSWYLLVSGLVVTGGTVSALATAPTPRSENS